MQGDKQDTIKRMGLGLAALGRPGYINLGHAEDLRGDYDVNAMRKRAHEVLDAAYDAGVRYFDAARSYGEAEEFLGSWLREKEPSHVTIASKWGYTYTADWKVEAEKHEVKDHSLETLERQWSQTWDTLGNDIDLYQIHSATLETGVLDDPQVLKRLVAIKEQSVRVGLSLSGTGQTETLRKALGVTVDGRPLFDAVQATHNLLERGAGPTLREAHEQGWRVIIKEGLANGRLTNRNTMQEDAERLGVLNRQVEALGTTRDALALAFLLSQPWVDMVLSGAATREHLTSNLGAVSLIETRWSEDLDRALAPLEQKSPEYWRFRASLPWQ